MKVKDSSIQLKEQISGISERQIEQIAEYIIDSKRESKLQDSVKTLKQNLLAVQRKFIENDGNVVEESSQQYLIYLLNYKDAGSDLVQALRKRNYVQFEQILTDRKKAPSFKKDDIVMIADYIIGQNNDTKALKLLLKHSPDYQLSQTTITSGGTEIIRYFSSLKGREHEAAKELGLTIDDVKLLHQEAMEQVKIDCLRVGHLPDEKIKNMIKIGLDYYNNPNDKIEYLNYLANHNSVQSNESPRFKNILIEALREHYKARFKTQGINNQEKELDKISKLFNSNKKDNNVKQEMLSGIEDLIHSFEDKIILKYSNMEEKEIFKFCHDIAVQACNSSKISLNDKRKDELVIALTKELTQKREINEIFTDIIKNIPKSKNSDGQPSNNFQNIYKEQLIDNLSELISEESIKKRPQEKLFKHLIKEKELEHQLTEFTKKEDQKAELSMMKRIIHKVKKLLLPNYNIKSYNNKLEKVRDKLQPFRENLAEKVKFSSFVNGASSRGSSLSK